MGARQRLGVINPVDLGLVRQPIVDWNTTLCADACENRIPKPERRPTYTAAPQHNHRTSLPLRFLPRLTL